MILIFSIFFIILISYYNIAIRQLYSSPAIIKGNTDFKPNKLMIIAHPTDEIIYGGVDLHNDRDWFVVCVTNGSPKSENIFARKCKKDSFVKVMNQLQCKYEIWDYEESFYNDNWDESLEKRLNSLLQVKFDKVVTYDTNNISYYNKQQKKLGLVVKKLTDNNKINHLSSFDNNEISSDTINNLIEYLSHYPYASSLRRKFFDHKSILITT